MLNLRILRKQNNMSMKELGTILGLAESTISLYETGKREPDISTLLSIADYFDVSVDELLNHKTKEANNMMRKSVNGYKIVGNFKNRVVIAYNPNAVEPWVVWRLDSDGDPYSGSYFTSKDSALREFSERALGCMF